jgi:23S rRNA pseudouridine2605 synthase
MRLVKYLAHSGVASRRASEEIIAAGRVRVGGEVVTDPARDVDAGSGVEVDGRPVSPESHEIWMLNKPLNVVSTAKEPGRRRSVVDLIRSDRRLYPVGRLDADSSGLILISNDGELANRLTHPRYEVPKTYRVELTRAPKEALVRRLREGPQLEDGPTNPAKVRRTGDQELEVTISEGRNRQVRRMVEAVGGKVAALERVSFGSLRLGDLEVGESRQLTRSEVRRLWKDAGSMDEVQDKPGKGERRG